MKVVILAGGLGTRISEESHLKPKPMINIGEQPILWHIMKEYSYYGFNEFIICLGYKGYCIKEYFADYFLHTSDVTFDLAKNEMKVHNNNCEDWIVTLIDTGLNTMTAGRIKRIQQYIGEEPFMLTYGDGVSDINISELLKFHENHGKIATMTAIKPGQRFGVLDLTSDNMVRAFREKNIEDSNYINGGYMVLEPEIFKYLDKNCDNMPFEKEPLENLAKDGQIVAYKHSGFWKCMDTQRDKKELEELWTSEQAPWKVW